MHETRGSNNRIVIRLRIGNMKLGRAERDA